MRPDASLTIVDEVLEDLFAAGLHGVMQQRAAGGVLQQHVSPLLVELHQLHDGNTDRKETLFKKEKIHRDTFRRASKVQRHTHSVQVPSLDAADQLCI